MRLIIPGADFSENAIGTEKVYTLQQGYATAAPLHNPPDIGIGNLSNRVMSNQLLGSYTIKTNPGYAIRAIVTYSSSIEIPSPAPSPAQNIPATNPANVSDVQGLTEFTLNNPGAYSIITFCKTDATQNLSPTDDIVAELY